MNSIKFNVAEKTITVNVDGAEVTFYDGESYKTAFPEREADWDALEASQNQQPIAPTVPQSLSRAQARAALILAGLIDQVQPAIDTIADPLQRALVQNDWDNRSTFDRDNPTLLALAEALGLTDAQLDDLFVQGAKL